MSNPFLGQIMAFGGTFAPRGWAFCQGQLLGIPQNTALFSLLGTTYGGNGTTNFGLPDLRGRAIVGAGQGPGLGNYTIGQMGGAEHVTLSQGQMPAHNHTVNARAVKTGSTASSPSGALPGNSAANIYDPPSAGSAVTMDTSMISTVGGSTPVPTTTPFTCINYIIALQGIYPSRN